MLGFDTTVVFVVARTRTDTTATLESVAPSFALNANVSTPEKPRSGRYVNVGVMLLMGAC